ncbi:MAG: purine-nucleoside phosphorylase [Myxococcota bacterium]|jgi:purine-nucleoside phosphorylase
MNILILAAAAEELGTLPGAVVGVGPIAAATTAARILAERRPDAVILIGTAGAYAGGPAIGTVIASETLGWSYGVAAMGLGYVPRPPQPIRGDASLLERLNLPRHAVLTTGAVTTDPTLAGRLSDGFSVEHLEAFSVAMACQDVGIPFVAILGIANVVGPGAHVEWLAHRDEAQDAARAAARALVEAG